MNSIEAGILLETDDDRIEYVNPVCVRWSATQLKIWWDSPQIFSFHQRWAVSWTGRLWGARGEKGRYEVSLLCKDGAELPVLVGATPMYSGGMFTGTLTAFTDITQRKRTGADVARAQQRGCPGALRHRPAASVRHYQR